MNLSIHKEYHSKSYHSDMKYHITLNARYGVVGNMVSFDTQKEWSIWHYFSTTVDMCLSFSVPSQKVSIMMSFWSLQVWHILNLSWAWENLNQYSMKGFRSHAWNCRKIWRIVLSFWVPRLGPRLLYAFTPQLPWDFSPLYVCKVCSPITENVIFRPVFGNKLQI